jgi:hypothetical protein
MVVIVAAMSRPLPHGDPTHLGPFELTARLSETPAGIIYLGHDGQGRQVSVTVLTRGAAGDPAARDRFRAAIVSAERDGTTPVVAAEPDGSTPWVATAYEAGAQDAERFLDSVLLTGTFWGRAGRAWTGRLRGPQFQPHWMGSREPAVAAPPSYGPADDIDPPAERGLLAAILMLAALLAVLFLLLSMLFACQPEPPPPTPTIFPSPTFEEPTPPPTTPSPSSTPTRTRTGSPTPAPSGSGGPDGGSA